MVPPAHIPFLPKTLFCGKDCAKDANAKLSEFCFVNEIRVDDADEIA